MSHPMANAKTTPIPPNAIKQAIFVEVLGHPYVKKSNQRVQMRGRHPVKVNTPNYNAWAKSARKQINDRVIKPANPIDYPVNLKCRFFVRTRGAVDLSALYEGIQDILVELKILADDEWKIVASHDGSGVEWDPDRPRMEITITRRDDIVLPPPPAKKKKKETNPDETSPF